MLYIGPYLATGRLFEGDTQPEGKMSYPVHVVLDRVGRAVLSF